MRNRWRHFVLLLALAIAFTNILACGDDDDDDGDDDKPFGSDEIEQCKLEGQHQIDVAIYDPPDKETVYSNCDECGCQNCRYSPDYDGPGDLDRRTSQNMCPYLRDQDWCDWMLHEVCPNVEPQNDRGTCDIYADWCAQLNY
ncbi:MAG: hypothetical protein M5R36_14500 [Deltaproteobacteria bacterium]|nr:hypothetical protein [Deltaproteobacteria bacterium]